LIHFLIAVLWAPAGIMQAVLAMQLMDVTRAESMWQLVLPAAILTVLYQRQELQRAGETRKMEI
jgi:hypothetical protein